MLPNKDQRSNHLNIIDEADMSCSAYEIVQISIITSQLLL